MAATTKPDSDSGNAFLAGLARRGVYAPTVDEYEHTREWVVDLVSGRVVRAECRECHP